mgnify:CR=1 FL=1
MNLERPFVIKEAKHFPTQIERARTVKLSPLDSKKPLPKAGAFLQEVKLFQATSSSGSFFSGRMFQNSSQEP